MERPVPGARLRPVHQLGEGEDDPAAKRWPFRRSTRTPGRWRLLKEQSSSTRCLPTSRGLTARKSAKPRLSQPGRNPDVSGGRPCARERLKFSDVPPDWKFATALASADNGFAADSYDQHGGFAGRSGTFQESDFDEGGGHYRVVVDADRSDYDMPKIVFGRAQARCRGHELDAGSSISNVPVSLSLSAWARRRRNGACVLHRHRTERAQP